ncbi:MULTISPECIES: crotonase/enoyl-CoA hydratase family protein [Rhodomicrobium]|uniref:crotonase/enoyl-CoA hydratase family protein n=1 Tax=Rhodomicrobium TaxID=1068 RepID=UPI000B4B3779|nr:MULTISPECIES: crotonase/enoyl-CoA hydratase family protein [Rhodomicrobium]
MQISVDGVAYQWPDEAHAAAASDRPLPPTLWDNPGAIRLATILGGLDLFELKLEIDIDLCTIWCFQQHREGGSFAPRLLRDIRTVQRALHDFHRDEPHDAAELAKFLVWASATDGIFNLGGDLRYFERLVRQKDHERLRAYALSCVDVCFTNYSGLDAPMIVGALVAGDALGGGMESALSCDFIFAEEQAKFGLPEMLYGLFPGMGAYSFLMRRIGQAKTESLILQGDLYSASEMAEMDLVEKVVARGSGRAEMNRHLGRLLRRFNASRAIYNARRRCFPIGFQEMADIVEEWVCVAMQLSDYDLRKMNKLAAAQGGRLRAAEQSRQLENGTA